MVGVRLAVAIAGKEADHDVQKIEHEITEAEKAIENDETGTFA